MCWQLPRDWERAGTFWKRRGALQLLLLHAQGVASAHPVTVSAWGTAHRGTAGHGEVTRRLQPGLAEMRRQRGCGDVSLWRGSLRDGSGAREAAC